MFGNFIRIFLTSILFCLAIFCQTCSSSQYIDGTENWVAFGETVKAGTPEVVDSVLDGEAVYLTGRLSAREFIEDEQFGVSYKGLSLKRDVEMYQWEESVYIPKHTNDYKIGNKGRGSGPQTTYDYDTIWTLKAIDHGSFEYPEGHENLPVVSNAGGVTLQADYYALGNHQVAGDIYALISYDTARLEKPRTKLDLPPEAVAEFTDRGLILYPSQQVRQSPKVGDIRYLYTTNSSDLVSIIGAQMDNRIEGENGTTRFTGMAGSLPLQSVINHQVDELKETSDLGVFMTFF
ncbi:MAG: TMEM43 family protein, partial [Bacteroidota bacterium]